MTDTPRETRPPQDGSMTFFDSIGSVLRKYAEFRGRASRSEFWWWALFTFLATAVLAAIPFDQSRLSSSPYVAAWSLVVLLPSLAVEVRRLRDAGRGWGHVFWILLPIAGPIVLVVLLTRPTVPTRAEGHGGVTVPSDAAVG
jgi:uncharacterized membrane protein YhaH (DUF805 family)